jgi:hypothetical protein
MWSWLNNLLALLEEALGGSKYAPPEPVITPQMPPTATQPVQPTPTLLDTFCAAIAFREGANPTNNNEGNCKFYYGGYLPIYGIVKRSVGGFAMFPTKAQGDLYLQNLIKGIIHNHPNLTFLTFFAGNGKGWGGYAPAADKNDPVSYAEQVAGKCGVSVYSGVDIIIS